MIPIAQSNYSENAVVNSTSSPGVMGIGQDFSSANDTDTDVDETIVHTNIDKFDNCLGETNY